MLILLHGWKAKCLPTRGAGREAMRNDMEAVEQFERILQKEGA
jgi:hypothetical protein